MEDVLPVEIEPVYDDRVERPEGGTVTLTDADHYVTDHLDAGSFPEVYGYNEVAGLRDDATELMTVDGNPLLAVDAFGDGRTVVYASDPGPKWGYGVMDWDGYDEFFVRALEWATGSASE